MGLHMEDPLYSGDVTSLVTSACAFTLVGEDPATLPFFSGLADDGKVDYNLDNCFETLEDVDNLLRSLATCDFFANHGEGPTLHVHPLTPLDSSSGVGPRCSGPELDFESVTSSHPDIMEWDDSSASPPGIDCRAAVEKSIDDFDPKLDFVPIVDSLPMLPVEDAEDLSIKDPVNELHFVHQLQAQFIGVDPLPAGKVIAGISPFSEDGGNNATVSEILGNSRPSTVSHLDSGKVNMAQAHRQRRHAGGNNRRRREYRTKRKLNNHPKILQVNNCPYSNLQAPILHPIIPLHCLSTTQAIGHLHNPLVSTIIPGYASIPTRPMIDPASSLYIHVGYNNPPNPPIEQPLPPMAPNHVPFQIMRSQGLRVSCQEDAFQQITMPPHQEPHLWASSEALTRPATSSPPMILQEKAEKFEFLQQLQAQISVADQSQEYTPVGSSALCNGIAQLPHVLAGAPTTSEPGMPAVLECDSELSLIVGQINIEGIAAAENGGASVEELVLDQLLKATKTLGTETQLCIRDALYRLAQSAAKRQVFLGGGHIDGSDMAHNSQLSKEVDAKTSNGVDTSIGSDPLSTNKVSRMNLETNPIDRSTARLLFHKKWQLASGQVKLNVDGSSLGGQLSNLPLKRQHCNVSLGNWVSNPQVMPSGEVGQRISKTLEQQSKYINLPPLATENPQIGCGHQQQQQQSRVGKSYILNTEQHFESPVGSESCSATNNEQHRVLRSSSQDLLTTFVQVNSSKVKNIGPSKRLEHAIGLKELSQLLSEGLEIPGFSLYEDEERGFAHLSPVGSHSSGFNEFQASNFTKRSDIPGLVGTPKTLIEQRG